MLSYRRIGFAHGYQTVLAQPPRPLGHPRPTPVAAFRPGFAGSTGGGPAARTGSALPHSPRRQIARPATGAALAQRPAAQQSLSSPGADDAISGDSVRPVPGTGPEQNRHVVYRQCGAGVHHPVHDAGGERPAQRLAGYLRTHRTCPHPLDQGLCATDKNGAVRVRRDHHRRHPDRPLALVAAVRFGCDVGGDFVGVQGHPAVIRRQRATDQQRHAAGRRLDRNASGRRRR